MVLDNLIDVIIVVDIGDYGVVADPIKDHCLPYFFFVYWDRCLFF